MIYNLILETWMAFAFFLLDLLLLKITLRREFLQNFNLLETKVNPARNSSVWSLVFMFSVYFFFPVFKAYQLFLLEINVLYNLILNIGMFIYHASKISRKILPLSYSFVDICLQNWRPIFAEIVFSRDTFHSNLRKTDRFFHQHQVHYNGTKKGQRPLYDFTRYNALKDFCNSKLLHIRLFKVMPHWSGDEYYNQAKRC